MSQNNKSKGKRGVEGRGEIYMKQMKRHKNDKRGNGFWWLVVIMCADFGGIHLVDIQQYGCFILIEN